VQASTTRALNSRPACLLTCSRAASMPSAGRWGPWRGVGDSGLSQSSKRAGEARAPAGGLAVAIPHPGPFPMIDRPGPFPSVLPPKTPPIPQAASARDRHWSRLHRRDPWGGSQGFGYFVGGWPCARPVTSLLSCP
jgi:hypothetical protein